MERRKFEESWKEAFDQAEISPSENVWTNIELDLEKAKARKLKRRLVFYQLLAAASVIFALGIGLGVYIGNTNNPGNTLALQQPNSGASADDLTTRSANPASNNPSDKNQENAGTQRSAVDPGTLQQGDEQNRSADGNVAEDMNRKDLNRRNDQPIAASTESTAPSNNNPANTAVQQDNRGQQASQVDARRSQTGIARAETKNADGSQRNASGTATQNNTSDVTSSHIADKQSRELIADNSTHRNGLQNNAAADQASVTERDNGKAALSTVNGMTASPTDVSPKEVVAISEHPSKDEKESTGVFQPAFERKLPPLVVERKPELIVAQKEAEADPVALMLARLERREQEVRAQDEKQEKQSEKDKHGGSERLWTSVGFAAGSFNPVVTKTSPPMLMAASNFASTNASKEMQAKGSTYSVGVNMGKRLSERWVLQGGVNYLTQASDYTQNGLVPDPNNSMLKAPSNFRQDAFMSSESDIRQAVVDTPPYNVNNSVRYLSVPMQAGYMLVNRDFGLQLNAGVSTDLLLQNNISTSAVVEGQAVDADFEGSAYRQVNLSGLMGTEVSYRFGRRYRIALNPGMRYPFTNIYKSDDFRATRLSFDVGLRFRYIFN
ncbi:outer membrane beta-barrel protein [Fulvivirgaceae bacterium PWU4]|uniref:Outer membrane beta-barrel protein n=1 Tax=Chryseosolibacter histidini TaxID=2782349 RepID=A0AAP2GJ01_9BACT|nr:outer membrane beta-barrel protein [Chryseosolibacter histidini]MBT1697821.1 outer membrane beta-barrel protein [Chryseosolibacter histidini]